MLIKKNYYTIAKVRFPLAPLSFQLLYFIRVKVNGVFVTPVYVLLKTKTQSTYEIMFDVILQKCEYKNLFTDTKIINVDFEKAVIN